MKKIIIKAFLLVALSISSYSGKALRTPDKNILIQTEKTIQFFFANPAFKTSEKRIEVLFTTGETGLINFVLVKTQDEPAKKEIEKQFYGMSFPYLTKGAVNSVVLSFKTK